MAFIAYALCHKHGFNPELAYFESDGEFSHGACRIKVNNNFYMLDPWANILCEEKKYLSTLRDKMEEWSKAGKYVLCGDSLSIIGYVTGQLPDGVKVLPTEALKLKLVSSNPLAGKNNIVSSEFFDLIENKLAKKKLVNKGAINLLPSVLLEARLRLSNIYISDRNLILITYSYAKTVPFSFLRLRISAMALGMKS